MVSSNRNKAQKPLKKKKMQREPERERVPEAGPEAEPEAQMDVPSLDSFPEEVLSIIITKMDPQLQQVATLRTVSKTFFTMTSAESTLKHVLGPLVAPKIVAMGMQTTSDGCHQFDARAVFKYISELASNPHNNFWAMVRVVDEEKFLRLFSNKRFLVNLLKVGEELFDSENTKVCLMDPYTGDWCLAVAAYHPCFEIKGEGNPFDGEGNPRGLGNPFDGEGNPLERDGQEYRQETSHLTFSVESSRFDGKCAYFFMAYNPHISGHFGAKLPPGRYSFSWVWYFEDEEMNPEEVMDITEGTEEFIAITSKFTNGQVHYKWRLSTYEGSEWKLKWITRDHRGRPTRNTYSESTRELVESAKKSIRQPHNLKVQGDAFLEHEIGQFRVTQESDGSFETSDLDFDMKDETGTLGAEGGLYFDGFIIRCLG